MNYFNHKSFRYIFVLVSAVLVSGCSSRPEWEPLAEKLCDKNEELLDLLVGFSSAEDVLDSKKVDRLKKWRSEYIDAQKELLNFFLDRYDSETYSRPPGFQTFELRFDNAKEKNRKEIERILQIQETGSSDEYKDAQSRVIAYATFPGNIFVEKY